MLEAMASGAFVVGSATAPVHEVIEDGQNGWLVDFFDPYAIAARVADALAKRNDVDALRAAARETVVARYDLRSCFNAQKVLMNDAVTAFEEPR